MWLTDLRLFSCFVLNKNSVNPPLFILRSHSRYSDIDECSTSSHNCSELCENTDGGYKCSCVKGNNLALDNRTCQCKCALMHVTIVAKG